MNIIEKVYNELKKQQIKPIRLAEHLKISTGQLSNWKARGTDPRPVQVQEMADFLGVSYAYLIGKQEEPNLIKNKDVPEEFVVMARKTGKLKDGQREKLYKMLDKTIDDVLAMLEDEDDE